MNEIKFNSQVCTTRDQSQRLLELGLKPETADMMYLWKCRPCIWHDDYEVDDENIPAWSLHRLIEIAELPYSWECISGDWYNEVIADIQSKIHIGELNKEYLND